MQLTQTGIHKHEHIYTHIDIDNLDDKRTDMPDKTGEERTYLIGKDHHEGGVLHAIVHELGARSRHKQRQPVEPAREPVFARSRDHVRPQGVLC